MRPSSKWLYRLASVIFFLFASGHTAGFLTFHPADAGARAVLEGMRQVHFDAGGASVTWMGFYTGFGLFVSVYSFFSAFLAWRLSNAGEADAAMARSIAWGLFTAQIGNIALCLYYFGPVQAILVVACAASVGAAALRTVSHAAPNTRAKIAST